MSRLRSRTRTKAGNVRAEIQDKLKVFKFNGKHRYILWSTLQVSCVILFDVKCGLNHIVQVNALYLVWVKESRALLHVPGHSSTAQDVPGLNQRVQVIIYSSRCARSKSKSPGYSYMYLVTLHTAQDVPGLSQRTQVTIYSSRCARSKSKSPGHSYMYPVTLHTAQDVPGMNKQSRAQFKLHQV